MRHDEIIKRPEAPDIADTKAYAEWELLNIEFDRLFLKLTGFKSGRELEVKLEEQLYGRCYFDEAKDKLRSDLKRMNAPHSPIISKDLQEKLTTELMSVESMQELGLWFIKTCVSINPRSEDLAKKEWDEFLLNPDYTDTRLAYCVNIA